MRSSMPAVPGPQANSQRGQPGRAEALEALKAQMAALRLPSAGEPFAMLLPLVHYRKPCQPAAHACAG